jgi:hypothetical protein
MPAGDAGKQPKSDTNGRSRQVSTGDCMRARGAARRARRPERVSYADSLTKRPMRAYFSGFRVRTR